MARPKKENKEEIVHISAKLSKELVDCLDVIAWGNKKSRTDIIKEACEMRTWMFHCPKCGKLNLKGSVLCSYCGERIDDEWFNIKYKAAERVCEKYTQKNKKITSDSKYGVAISGSLDENGKPTGIMAYWISATCNTSDGERLVFIKEITRKELDEEIALMQAGI